jgi:hypothetical protein
MLDQKEGSLVTCMAFIEIVDYARKPVAEQIKLTERFNLRLSDALKPVAPGDRIVLDTGNGAALAFLGKPEGALQVAISLRDEIAADPSPSGPTMMVRIGINIGPVKLVKDASGDPSIIGDGIVVAQSVTSFAAPGQILVSHSYREAVSRVSKEYARLLNSESSRTDKYLREHRVYAVVSPTGMPPASAPDGASDPVSGRNRNLRIGALAAVAAILVIAVGVRSSRIKQSPPAETAPAAVVATDSVAATPPVAPEAIPAAPPQAEVKTQKKKTIKPKVDVASAATPVQAASPPTPVAVQVPPGSLGFAIAPWGEIYIDGAKRGVSPPLTEVQVAPGKHNIEVRNTSFPSYSTTIEVTSGVQSKIKYKFN